MTVKTAAGVAPFDGHYDVGDIVELVIGSAPMVVTNVCDHCGEVETVYCDSDGDIVFNTFDPIVLELAS
jgi:hypothetical protein